MVCEGGTLTLDWTLEGGDYYDYTDTEQTETGSEDFDCESGIPLYEASVEILENCVGKPCEEGRRVLLNRDENQTEKEIIQILLCQDGTWTIEDYWDSGGPFTESGSESATELTETDGDDDSAIIDESESNTDTDSSEVDESESEWLCAGPCCHGASFVEECVGQPCDVPNDYDYESKQAAPGDQKSPYYSEILKS